MDCAELGCQSQQEECFMGGLLMVSIGLLVLVVWGLSMGALLGNSDFETNLVRYSQALLFPPITVGFLWLTILSAGNLYKIMPVWLNVEPVSSGMSLILIILALLVCLPILVGGIFFTHLWLLRLDSYLDPNEY